MDSMERNYTLALLLQQYAQNAQTHVIKQYPLLKAVKTGNLEEVKKLFVEDYEGPEFDINEINPAEVDDFGRSVSITPLVHAIRQGYIDIAEYLISKDISIVNYNNTVYKLFSPALEIAILYNEDFAKKLINEYNADLTIELRGDFTFLHYACEYGDLELIKLIASKASSTINQLTEFHGAPPFFGVLSNKRVLKLDAIKYLIEECGADDSIRNHDQDTLLHTLASREEEACSPEEQVLIATYLINERKIFVNSLERNDRTPLHFAAMYANLELTKYLINNGANINSRDANNLTPLDLAATRGMANSIAIVKYLLQVGAVGNLLEEEVILQEEAITIIDQNTIKALNMQDLIIQTVIAFDLCTAFFKPKDILLEKLLYEKAKEIFSFIMLGFNLIEEAQSTVSYYVEPDKIHTLDNVELKDILRERVKNLLKQGLPKPYQTFSEYKSALINSLKENNLFNDKVLYEILWENSLTIDGNKGILEEFSAQIFQAESELRNKIFNTNSPASYLEVKLLLSHNISDNKDFCSNYFNVYNDLVNLLKGYILENSNTEVLSIIQNLQSLFYKSSSNLDKLDKLKDGISALQQKLQEEKFSLDFLKFILSNDTTIELQVFYLCFPQYTKEGYLILDSLNCNFKYLGITPSKIEAIFTESSREFLDEINSIPLDDRKLALQVYKNLHLCKQVNKNFNTKTTYSQENVEYECPPSKKVKLDNAESEVPLVEENESFILTEEQIPGLLSPEILDPEHLGPKLLGEDSESLI